MGTTSDIQEWESRVGSKSYKQKQKDIVAGNSEESTMGIQNMSQDWDSQESIDNDNLERQLRVGGTIMRHAKNTNTIWMLATCLCGALLFTFA